MGSETGEGTGPCSEVTQVCLEMGGVGGTHPAKGTQVSLGDQQPLGVATLGQNVDEQVLVTAWKRVVLERQ